jgi:DNA processing protein
MTRVLSHAERVSWLRLARTPRIGPLTFHRLLARFSSADAVLEAAPRLAHGTLKAPPVDEIEAELEGLEAMGACLIASCETGYPAGLAGLDAPPPVISARGQTAWLEKPAIALVGAREASAAGAKLAADLARDLGGAGYVVVSGLARGIDAAAHRAALDTGTIAVLAGGLDKPYPPQNEKLHDAIAAQGCVVSETPLGVAPRARDFPRRNHLISGLARAVVVVEAAERSGSLITARAAAEQGREVMAAPGSPLDPRARGSNRLIKQGAALIESAEDVIAALEGAPRTMRATPPFLFEAPAPTPRADEDRELLGRLAALLSPTPVHLNELARQLGAPLNLAAAALTDLEMDGRAISLSGGYAVSATPKASQG